MSKKQDIKALVSKILETRSNAKLIPELIEALSEKSTSKSALNGLLKVFTQLIKNNGDLKPLKGNKNESDPAFKYASWLFKVFDEAFDKITELIDDGDDLSFQTLSLTTSVKLITVAHDDNDEKKSWTSQDSNRFKKILEAIVSEKNHNSTLVERFQEYLEYSDTKYHTILILSKMARKHESLEFRSNMLKMLEILNFEESPQASEGLVIKDFKFTEENQSKNFNNLWQEFSKQVHKEVDIYKRLLILLTDKVMPVLKNPLYFTDFFINSYNGKSSIFLSLRFYVKSKLEQKESQKLPSLHI